MANLDSTARLPGIGPTRPLFGARRNGMQKPNGWKYAWKEQFLAKEMRRLVDIAPDGLHVSMGTQAGRHSIRKLRELLTKSGTPAWRKSGNLFTSISVCLVGDSFV